MTKKILILGINGFIGSHLVEHILHQKNWLIYGMDLASDKLGASLSHTRLHFKQGDITKDLDWIEAHIKQCDSVLPLAAIANPAIYVKDPIRVFELDFEANLAIVKLCVKHKKRIIFPSTSEVYGMCADQEFDEEKSNLVLGPVTKPRWIYSSSKQLMDRVIVSHGVQNNLDFTLFRPFNWIGPRLDNIFNSQEGSSRAFSQFIGNILRGKDIYLVNGGEQHRCFTYVDDSIDALLRIIENQNDCATRKIFNIGNPKNNASIRELAELLLEHIKTYPQHQKNANQVKLISVASDEYYGAGYQDVGLRVPSIKMANKYLNWVPKTSLVEAIQKTLDYYLPVDLAEVT